MSTASEWASVMVGGVQFAAGIAVAWYTLAKQHDDGIAQRDGAWFHLVVADKTIEALHELTERETEALDLAAERCEAIKASGQPQANVDEVFRAELQGFHTRIAPIVRKLSNFAYIFDQELYVTVSRAFQNMEDRVAEWFDRLQLQGPLERREALTETVCECQRELLQSFRNFEFITLPSREQARRNSFRWSIAAPGLFFLISAGLAYWSSSFITLSFQGSQYKLRTDGGLSIILGSIGLICLTWAIAQARRNER